MRSLWCARTAAVWFQYEKKNKPGKWHVCESRTYLFVPAVQVGRTVCVWRKTFVFGLCAQGLRVSAPLSTSFFPETPWRRDLPNALPPWVKVFVFLRFSGSGGQSENRLAHRSFPSKPLCSNIEIEKKMPPPPARQGGGGGEPSIWQKSAFLGRT